MPPPAGLLRKLLVVTVVAEAATGVALVILPGAAFWAVFGSASDGAGQTMGRLAGVGLGALAVSYSPGDGARGPQRRNLCCNALGPILVVAGGASLQRARCVPLPAPHAHRDAHCL